MSNSDQKEYQLNRIMHDRSIAEDIVDFHFRGAHVMDSRFSAMLSYPPVSKDFLENIEFSDPEISPFYSNEVSLAHISPRATKRKESATDFTEALLDYNDIAQILVDSFCSFDGKKRPYPSGGALYPIIVLCALFSERLCGSPESGVYHYRPYRNTLQPVQICGSEDLRTHLAVSGSKMNPHACLIYLGHLPKTIIKYRYRGYRHALIEAGIMTQRVDGVVNELGLSNRVMSAFDDYGLMKFLDLDNHHYLPIIMQYLGKSNDSKL